MILHCKQYIELLPNPNLKIPYSPNFSRFDGVQLFSNKIFMFTKNDLTWRACMTIIFANKIFVVRQFSQKNATFIARENLELYTLYVIIIHVYIFVCVLCIPQHIPQDIIQHFTYLKCFYNYVIYSIVLNSYQKD